METRRLALGWVVVTRLKPTYEGWKRGADGRSSARQTGFEAYL